MKPKLLAIKHGDKVLLLLLLAFLIWAIAGIFRSSPESTVEYGAKLDSLVQKVSDRHAKSQPKPEEDTNSERLKVLVNGIRNPAVVEAVNSAALFPKGQVWHQKIITLLYDSRKKNEVQVVLKDVEIVAEQKPVEGMKVFWEYDPAKNETTVHIQGNTITGEQGVALVLRDKEETDHVFQIAVIDEKDRGGKRPLPPATARTSVLRGSVFITAQLVPPRTTTGAGPAPAPSAMAAGYVAGEQVAKGDGIRVYRRPKGKLDAEWVEATPTGGLAPAMTWDGFVEYLYTVRAVTREQAPTGRGKGGDAPTLLPGEGVVGPGRATGLPPGQQPKIYCGFVDGDATPGEDYDYKVYAVSKQSGNLVVESRGWIPLTGSMPPNILPYFAKPIQADHVAVTIRKFVYAKEADRDDYLMQAQLNDQRPGDSLGLKAVRVRAWDITQKNKTVWLDDADMTTNFWLLAIMPQQKLVPRVKRDKETKVEVVVKPDGTFVDKTVVRWIVKYDLKPEDQLVGVYLDKRGQINAKYAETPPAYPPRAPTPEKGVPGRGIPGPAEEGGMRGHVPWEP
jgi:hypothetical protein